MKAHQKGTVVEISGGCSLQDRLMSLGIYEGRKITRLNHMIFKGPVAVKVGSAVMALGHGMASKIIIEAE